MTSEVEAPGPSRAMKLKAEAFKVSMGMLSSSMQRTEEGITGKKTKGPLALSKNPDYSVSAIDVPSPRRFAKSKAVPKHPPEEHPDSLRSNDTDLLWYGGPTFETTRKRPEPPKARPSRKAFARFIPSHNKGQPTSIKRLEAIAERKAEDAFMRQYAARPPAHLAVRLSTQVLQMCKEQGIDWNALMREGANPLADEVDAVRGPYAPLWEDAFAEEEVMKRDPLVEEAPVPLPTPPSRNASRRKPNAAEQSKASPRSARSAPPEETLSRQERIQRGKERSRARRAEEEAERAALDTESGGGGGSQSARAARTRPRPPEEVLDEMEYEKTEKVC